MTRSMLCQTCSLRHTPFCSPARRWPLEPLAALLPHGLTDNAIGDALGLQATTIARARANGLNDRQADHAAIHIGSHPGAVWPDWFDAGLTVVDRQYLEGGWRHGWLWAEAPTESEQAA